VYAYVLHTSPFSDDIWREMREDLITLVRPKWPGQMYYFSKPSLTKRTYLISIPKNEIQKRYPLSSSLVPQRFSNFASTAGIKLYTRILLLLCERMGHKKIHRPALGPFIRCVPIQSLHALGPSHIIAHQASNLPIPSPPFSSFNFPPELFKLALLFHLPNFPGLPPSPTAPAPAVATFSLLAFVALPSAQPFLRSLAQAPQDEMYAPAFCPAACTDACAAVMSGARATKRDGGGDLSDVVWSLLGVPLLEFASWLSSARLRCASRIASISAQRFEKAVETFLWPVARCLFSASFEVASRSSRWSVWIWSARRRWMSSKLRFPAVGCRGSTMSKRWESVWVLKRVNEVVWRQWARKSGLKSVIGSPSMVGRGK